MKTNILTTLVLVFLLFNSGFSQSYEFKVLANKGNNKVKRSSGKDFPLKTGTILLSEDQLIVAQGAYIGLMHKTGKTIELRAAGVKNISELVQKLANSNRSVASKYAQFVMNKINESNEDINKNHRSNMRATGAVQRAFNSSGIDVLLPESPESVKILDHKVNILWSNNSKSQNATYMVSIKNIYDEELYRTETTETEISIDFDDENLSQDKFYAVHVVVKGNDSSSRDGYGLQKLDLKKRERILAELEEMKKELPENVAINNLALASYLDENELYLDAIKQYQLAVKNSSGSEDFKEILDDYLTERGFK